MLGQIAPRRDATVITLIHRQETISLLGFPRSRSTGRQHVVATPADVTAAIVRDLPDIASLARIVQQLGEAAFGRALRARRAVALASGTSRAARLVRCARSGPSAALTSMPRSVGLAIECATRLAASYGPCGSARRRANA